MIQIGMGQKLNFAKQEEEHVNIQLQHFLRDRHVHLATVLANVKQEDMDIAVLALHALVPR